MVFIARAIVALSLFFSCASFLHAQVSEIVAVSSQVHIYDFDATRDLENIMRLYQKNAQILAYEGYDFKAALQRGSMEPNSLEKLFVKVLYVNTEFAGFVVYGYYYNSYSRQNFIHVLAVEEKFRGQRLGAQLLEEATNHLLSNHKQYEPDTSCLIRLNTDVTNTPARQLYDRTGFKVLAVNGDYVNYFKVIEPRQELII